MTKPSPSPFADDLHQVRWLLGQALAVVAVMATFLLGGGFVPWALGGTALVAAATMRPALASVLPGWIHRLVFPAAVFLLAADLVLNRDPVPALVRLGTFLVVYRAAFPRSPREDQQLLGLGLFVLITTGILTLSPAFGVALGVFTLTALGLFTVRTLLEGRPPPASAAPASPRDWLPLAARLRSAMPPRALALWTALTLLVVPLAWAIFLLLPRFEMSKGLYLERLLARRNAVGFTDTVSIGDISRLKEDDAVAFRFDPRTPLPPLSFVYWRMAILDEYRDRTFRSSVAHRAFGYQPLTVEARLRDDAPAGGISGTIYLEPHVGRHLPLTGRFATLDFAEEREIRRARTAHLISLSRVPNTMMAYRVTSMETGAALAPGAFRTDPRAEVHHRELTLSEADQRQLLNHLNAIGTPPVDRAAFVRAAVDWLTRRHRYSLNSTIPAGQGDPLVRWMASEEPGHCELFAGSLVLLCRAAGIPARLVAGFAGGSQVDRFVVVRNRDAHAWVEVALNEGAWWRIDPTMQATRLQDGAAFAITSASTSDGFWARWAERLRVAWYRRVVNFDDSQREKVLKGAAASTSREIRRAALSWSRIPGWAKVTLGAVAVLGGAALLVRLWRGWHGGRLTEEERLRQTAGKWISKLTAKGIMKAPEGLGEELLRVRYGPRENWPPTTALFRRARRAATDLADTGKRS